MASSYPLGLYRITEGWLHRKRLLPPDGRAIHRLLSARIGQPGRFSVWFLIDRHFLFTNSQVILSANAQSCRHLRANPAHALGSQVTVLSYHVRNCLGCGLSFIAGGFGKAFARATASNLRNSAKTSFSCSVVGPLLWKAASTACDSTTSTTRTRMIFHASVQTSKSALLPFTGEISVP